MNCVMDTNNFIGRDLDEDNVSRCLDGAGEHLIDQQNLESWDSDSSACNSPRNGQGDFTETGVNDNPKEPEKWKYEEYCNNDIATIGMRLATVATLHPMDYAKTLVQLGYEPLPTEMSKTILGNSIQTYPNMFKYIGHIRRVDGIYGCYHGLKPRLIGYMASWILGKKIVDHCGLQLPKDVDANCGDYRNFIVTLKRDIALTATGLILSQPFHVISLRMMAQFVGRESVYDGICSSFLSIYRNDGVAGFFVGITPRLLCDISCVLLTRSVTFIANKYCIKDKLARQYNESFVQFFFSSLLYPLQVISTCMSVSGSGLKAAEGIGMVNCNSWIDGWKQLKARGEQRRGASVFWRSVPKAPKRALPTEYILPEKSSID